MASALAHVLETPGLTAKAHRRRLILLFAFFLTALVTRADVLSPGEYLRVCKGAVSTIFFPSIDDVHVTKKEGTVVFLSYVRKSDGSEWKVKCRIEGASVLWGTADGRWRTNPKDEKLSYRIDRARGSFTIRQIFDDGSSDEKTFSIEEYSKLASPNPTAPVSRD